MELIESINYLSCGTLGTLTKESNYNKLDEIRNDFVQFCLDLPSNLSWQQGWSIYTKTKEIVKEYINHINENYFRDFDTFLEKLSEDISSKILSDISIGTNNSSIIEKKIMAMLSLYCKDTFDIEDVEVLIGNILYCEDCNIYFAELVEESSNCPKCNKEIIL